jgi:tetratricopeptide (TPR) repeat protein
MPYVGREPIERVELLENHDEAYEVWRRAGVSGRMLVHVDAHHDMWWTPPGACVNIANYICPALRDGLVREVMWIVPDETWATREGLEAVGRHLEKITACYPSAPPVKVLPLRLLPALEGREVLLDIDVDFMVIPTVTYGGHSDRCSPLPWCWPEELVERLSARGVRTDLVTIASSVEGGFTPLKWKYLGDELVERLQRPPGRDFKGFAAIRRGCEAREAAIAEREFRRAAFLLPASAAPHYHISLLNAAQGRWSIARAAHARARELDASYETPFASAGFARCDEGQLSEAEEEHCRSLALNPEDAYACFGLGEVYARRRRWPEAERLLRRSLALDDHLVDAHRQLAHMLARLGRVEEAIYRYERSLILALNGRRSIRGPVVSRSTRGAHVLDPDHSRIHARLAQLHARVGVTEKAIASYRMSLAGGHDAIGLRCHLAWLYTRQRKWRESLTEMSRAVTLMSRLPVTRWFQKWRQKSSRKPKFQIVATASPAGPRGLADRWRRSRAPETDPTPAL